MASDFLVLGGAGMQGKITSRDLLENGFSVFIADLYKEGTEKILAYPKAEFDYIDLRDQQATTELIRRINPSVVVNCAEGDWNKNVYGSCLEAKKHVIDLGSDIPMTRDQFAMHKHFEKAGLTAITGCGSTPGINNVMFQYACNELDRVETVEAGFAWDSNIKKFVVPFSIESIVEEFTEPAPVITNRKWENKVPLRNIEEREFRNIGEQQCFFVRHPETYTFYELQKKKGIKNVRFYAGFPRHSAETIKTFIATGLGSKRPVTFDGQRIVPLEILAQVLKKLAFPKGYTEKENLWVNVSGKKNGKPQEIRMECLVDTLPGWEDAGCNIDTGMPASIIAQMVRDGRIFARGSFEPGPVVPIDAFFKELRTREMAVFRNGDPIN